MYNLLLFDLDNTLYDTRGPFSQLTQQLGLDFPEPLDTVYRRYAAFGQEAFDLVQSKQLTLSQSHIYRLRQLFDYYNLSATDQELLDYQDIYHDYQKQISLSDTMRQGLADLAEQYNLAILTNGPIQGQTAKLKALGLDEWISQDKWFISERIGTAKPHRNNFHFALRACAADPASSLMIGDSHHHDIEPAQALGMKTCWFNRQDQTPSTLATLTVFSEEELVYRLKHLDD